MLRLSFLATWSAALLATGLLLCCVVTNPSGSRARGAAVTPNAARNQADANGKTRPQAAAASLAARASSRRKTPVPAWKKNLVEWKTEKEHEEADNSFCYVCHLNYQDEKLVKYHAPAGVGCETCHGVSDKHSEDEDNVTPPDVMFSRPSIVPFCVACHPKETLLHEEDHKKLFAKRADSKKTCTGCHGKKHHLKVRTRKWNKETGKLEWYDGVRMMRQGGHY